MCARVILYGHLCFFLSRFPTLQGPLTPFAWGRWRSALNGTSSIAPEESPLWGVSAIHRTKSSSLVPLAWFSMSRLPKHFCAHWSQHLPCRCFFFVYCSRMIFGYFSKKSTFIKISLPLYLPNPPRVKNQGRTKDEPRNTQRTPNHPKVLFIKIGYLKEIFVTVASAICLPCQMPLSISFTPLCKVSLHSRTSAKMSHRW